MRKVIQISVIQLEQGTIAILALCDDGSIWKRAAGNTNTQWEETSPIPQPVTIIPKMPDPIPPSQWVDPRCPGCDRVMKTTIPQVRTEWECLYCEIKFRPGSKPQCGAV